MDTLESVSDAQQEMLVSDRADELEADGQARRGKATGDRNGRDASEIRRTIRAEEQGASGMILFGDASGFFANERSGGRSRRHGQRINSGIGHCQVQLLNEFFPQF